MAIKWNYVLPEPYIPERIKKLLTQSRCTERKSTN